MTQDIQVHGIVLDTALVKEYDKRLVILTAELGRITVFSNGARRKNSRLTSVSQKFVMGSFNIHPSGNSYKLVSAEITENFLELASDIEKMAYASFVCEYVGYFTRDGISAKDELNLLYVTFKAILREKQELELIRIIYMCKLLDVEGVGIQMNSCVKSGSTENLHYISVNDGGMISDDALARANRPMAISADTIYTLRYILSRSIGELYSFNVSESIFLELKKIVLLFSEKHCDRHFKSLDILKPLGYDS